MNGILVLIVEAPANALPVRHEFMVVPANIYDSLVGGTDELLVSTVSFETTTADTLTLGKISVTANDESAAVSISNVNAAGHGVYISTAGIEKSAVKMNSTNGSGLYIEAKTYGVYFYGETADIVGTFIDGALDLNLSIDSQKRVRIQPIGRFGF